MEEGDEQDSYREPFFDELEPEVRLGSAGLEQQWGLQTGVRVHPIQIPLQSTRPQQEV